MFSKEWKLLAACALAVTTLTACPHNKKKSREATTQFQGLWVNAEAADRLKEVGSVVDPRVSEGFCRAVNNHPRRLGLIRSFTGELMLDAWMIHPNGDVYRYSAYQNGPSQGYRNPKYRVGRINGLSFNRDQNTAMGTFASYQTNSPFSRGNGLLLLDNNFLSVSSSGGTGPYSQGTAQVTYTRVSEAQVSQMTSVIAVCNDSLDFGDGWGHGHGRPVAVPQPAPAAGFVPSPGQPQPSRCAVGQQCGGPEVLPPAK